MSKDAKIGFVVVFALLILLAFNAVRQSGVIGFTDQVALLFTQVHGLRAGDPVTIGGVPSGRVVDIDFAPDDIQESFIPITGGTKLVRALVDLGGRELPKESTYAIRIDLNGRRWLDITMSPSEETIGPHDHFFAEEAFGQDDQMQRTIRTFTTLAEQTEELRHELTAPEFLLRTKDTASNLRFYSRELVAASSQAPEQLKAMDQGLANQELVLLQQMELFDQRIVDVSRRMTELAPQLSETMSSWSHRMERQSERLASTLEMASVKSVEYQKILDQAVISKMDPKVIHEVIKKTKRWSRRLQEYRYLAEDLHSLTSDPKIRKDLTKVIDDFRAKSTELNEKVEKLEKSVNENSTVKSLTKEKDKSKK